MPLLTIPNTFVNSTPNATTLAQGAKPVDADKLNANFDAVAALFDTALDDDNFRQLSERKAMFSNAGHDHTGGANGKIITGSPESGMVLNISSGHDHDGTDSKLLAPATDEQPGAVKAITGTTDVVPASLVAQVEGSIGLLADVSEIYSVKVWQVIAGNGDTPWNAGQGAPNLNIPPSDGSLRGFFFTLTPIGGVGDGTAFQIYNLSAGSVTFNWAVITI